MGSRTALSRRRFLQGTLATAGASLLGCGVHRPKPSSPDGDAALLTIAAASTAIGARKLSPVELVRACLARIERHEGAVNAFVTVTADQAMADAHAADAEIKRGRWRGPLHGIPVAVKDNIDTAGLATTAASAAFAERVPTKDAEAWAHLRRAGAILVGKNNLHELALGTTSAISAAGVVRNPWDVTRVAGGSSGGSGAALAMGMCLGAVGTDTGGSVRIPAAACNVVGFRASSDLISAKGILNLSPTIDQIGPMARTVEDTMLMLAAMVAPGALGFGIDRLPAVGALRLGVVRDADPLCDEPVIAEIRDAIDAAVVVLRGLVGKVRDATVPMPGELGAIIEGEIHAAHAARADAIDPRTRAVVVGAAAVTADELRRKREQLAQHRARAHAELADIDVVVMPTLPAPPILLANADHPFAQSACTFAFSLGGMPSISVPCGFTRDGLPIGMLIAGARGADAYVLATAAAYQRATDWHTRRAPMLGLAN